jgi:GTPase SAR1 family protein
MGRYCQLMIGPAGAGKSTLCRTLQEHCETVGRTVHVANLDPAADSFGYAPVFDVRDLISSDDAMSQLSLGPNGALVACMEFLAENLDWLEDRLDAYESDYLILDCPGQIELYGHIPVMADIVRCLERSSYRVCSVFCLDAQFMGGPDKFIGGATACLAAMVRLELPHVSVLTKCDLLGSTRGLTRFADADVASVLADLDEATPPRFRALNAAMCALLDEYAMVSFFPLDRRDEDAVAGLMGLIDSSIGFGEDEEVRVKDHADDEGDAVEAMG